ncbi:MAG TPA: hypothetical protein VF188_07885, partial [Longimicrobiales bacterium]
MDQFRVRRVDPEGIISTVAGSGKRACSPRSVGGECVKGPLGNNGPATAAMFHTLAGIALGPDGALYVADRLLDRVFKVGSGLPGASIGDVLLASEDGTELYRFDASGRHLETLDTRAGAIRYAFGYDAAGRLVTVTDGDGLVTTIERDG